MLCIFFVSKLHAFYFPHFIRFKCEIKQNYWMCIENNKNIQIANNFNKNVSDNLHYFNLISRNINVTCFQNDCWQACLNTKDVCVNKNTEKYDEIVNTIGNNMLDILDIVILQYVDEFIKSEIELTKKILDMFNK